MLSARKSFGGAVLCIKSVRAMPKGRIHTCKPLRLGPAMVCSRNESSSIWFCAAWKTGPCRNGSQKLPHNSFPKRLELKITSRSSSSSSSSSSSPPPPQFQNASNTQLGSLLAWLKPQLLLPLKISKHSLVRVYAAFFLSIINWAVLPDYNPIVYTMLG